MEVWLAMNGCLRRIFASPLASVAAIKGKSSTQCAANPRVVCFVC